MSSVFRKGSIPVYRRVRPLTEVLREFPSEPAPGNGEAPEGRSTADRDAGNIIALAREEAARIIAEAHEEARRIIGEAQAASEKLRAEARAQGMIEGESQGREEFERSVKGLLDALAAARDEVARLRDTLLLEAEEELVRLSLGVAEHIVRREITLDPDFVLNTIRSALAEIGDKGRVRVRVNAWDLEKVRECRDDILRWAKDAHSIEIVEDPGVDQGGCVIETDFGSIDGRVATRLERVERAFESELEGGAR